MSWFLMHKNIVVAEMEIDSYSGKASKVRFSSSAKEHTPLGAEMNMMKFYAWWEDRAVPKTRKGANHALKELGLTSTQSMLVNNLALSLTDCYWIKPRMSDLCWEQVSLFRNNFIDIFGELTFDTTKHLSIKNNTVFKCASSQGELQKKWCIDNFGRRFMVKGNWGTSFQQSLNEILASEVHRLQGKFPYVQYYLTDVSVEDNKRGIGCYSYNFCSEDVEFISVWELLQTVKLKNNESWYNKLKSICVFRLGFSEEYVDNFLGYEILTDYLMSNTDRHMKNIGVLRNPDTLQYLGFAPIYDTGNSMFFRSITIPTSGFNKITTHSFVKREVDLLKLVKSRNLIDINKLPDEKFFVELYLKDIPERHCRIPDMYNAFRQKQYSLIRFMSGEDIWK